MTAPGGEPDAPAPGAELRRIEGLTSARRHAEALAAAGALLARAPSQRGALYLSALNRRLMGEPEVALRVLDVLERAHPGYGRLFEERGHCCAALGEAGRAISAFERAVAHNPTLKSSWAMLERLLRAAGETRRAAMAAQHRAGLDALPAAVVEAGSRFCDGELAAAETLLTDHVAREGRHVEALRLLGRIAQRRGSLQRAEQLLCEVVANAPGYAAARLDLVRVLIERQKYAAALEVVEERLLTAPGDADARFLRATIVAGLGRHDEAVPVLRELLAAAPGRNHLRIVLGHSLKALGRADEAVDAYREATSGEGEVGDAFFSLANLKTYSFSDREVERMRDLEAVAAPRPPDRAPLCFALGKAYADRGDHGTSWAFYRRGNALVSAGVGYRAETTERAAGRLRAVFTEEFLAARVGSGAIEADPIFVVGLPRSGSTLLEQILASHPQVDGTQELHEVSRIVADLQGDDGARYPEVLPSLRPDALARLGRRYLADTRGHRRGRPRFVDKMPNNFRHVGLIHLMLPNATIIDMRREPMACCVSNFRQLWARGQEFCYALDDIARYYRSYLTLMRHWDAVLPGRVLRVCYEDLVDDLEGGVRSVLAHCRLDFDPACLAFHRTARAVNTPSSEQVRRPLFRDGLSEWRHWERFLGPLREDLGDALVRWRD